MNIEYDVVFINPGNAAGIYQDLANDYAAIEPPTWSLLLAQSTRSVGYKVSIFDINAERLSTEESVELPFTTITSRRFCGYICFTIEVKHLPIYFSSLKQGITIET